jgi:hypothetical protein
MAETEDESARAARVAREREEREEELARVPVRSIDRAKWPAGVRQVALSEVGGLGIDANGRLHWDGKPVEIIGSRIDLTKGQFFLALGVFVFTAIAAIAAVAQGWAAYNDWACKVHWPAVCAPPVPLSAAETPRAKSSVAD